MRSPVPLPLPVLACALALVGAAGADAAEVAVLPVDAPGLLPAVRESLDAQLSAALKDAGFAVQDAEKTRRFVKDAVESGLSCSLLEDDCALKAAIAADVEAVVVARAVTVTDKLVLELRKIPVEGAAVGAAGVVDAVAADGSMSRLARRLVNPAEAGAATALPVPFVIEPKDVLIAVDGKVVEGAGNVLWLDPGPHLVQISRDGYDARSVAVDVDATRLPASVNVSLEKAFPLMVGVGIGVGVGGVMLAMASTAGVVFAESALAQPQEPADRDGLQGLGAVSFAGVIVGVVAAGVGTTVALVGGGE